jgi:hypothetical protein
VLSDTLGFTHAMMFGVLQRLSGADISIFPNVGGRFGFQRTSADRSPTPAGTRDGIGRPIMPSPGGGMSVERASETRAMYGDDVVYPLGGSLLRHIDRIGEISERDAGSPDQNGMAGRGALVAFGVRPQSDASVAFLVEALSTQSPLINLRQCA